MTANATPVSYGGSNVVPMKTANMVRLHKKKWMREMADAPPEVREAIKQACLEGRVEPANPEAFDGFLQGISTGDIDWTLTGTTVAKFWGPWKKEDIPPGNTLNYDSGNDGGFIIQWATKGAGFGEATFYLKDGKLRCDSEGMGRDFIKEVINHLLNQMVIDRDA